MLYQRLVLAFCMGMSALSYALGKAPEAYGQLSVEAEAMSGEVILDLDVLDDLDISGEEAMDEVLAEPMMPEIEEIPEEILRTEIITEARSPLTGEPMSAAEYAQLQAELNGANGTPTVSDDIRYLIFLLQFRRAIKPIVPFW